MKLFSGFGITLFLYKNSFGPLETNTILIGCSLTKKAAVIDPASSSTTLILEMAQKENLKIEKILLTHSHWDHFADAHLLKQKTDAELFVHSLDAPNLLQPGIDGLPLFIPIRQVAYDRLVKEGDMIEIGKICFVVIHTPGHSPGGVCYYSEENKLLISGDTIFCGCIGNLQLPTANREDMWKSLRKLKQLPPETKIIPGHGPNSTIGAEADHGIQDK